MRGRAAKKQQITEIPDIGDHVEEDPTKFIGEI